jgi:hypothetical protein
MNKIFKQERNRRLAVKMRRIIYRSVAVILIVFAALSAAMTLNSEIRAAVRNVVIQWFNTHTSFQYDKEPVNPVSAEWNPTYIPNGFVKTMSYFELGVTEIRYEAADGSTIDFNAFPLGSGTVAVDNENTEYREIVYNDVSYSIFESTNVEFPNVITWHNDICYFLLSSFSDTETMLEIADSVKQRE